MWDLWLLVVFGFFIGILASMVGVDGGVFIVPILTFFYGFKVKAATATSLTAVIFTAIASTINYRKQKRIYYKTGLVLAVTTTPGAYLGAYVATITDERLPGLTFGVFMILVALRTIFKLFRRKGEDKMRPMRTDTETVNSRKTMVIGAGLGFFGGFASGLLGIGGGTAVVPIMTIALGMPIHSATATSMFTMIFTAISGVTKYSQANLVNLPVALLLAAGTVFGAQVGAYTSRRLSGRKLSIIFALVLIVSSVNMIMKYK